MADGTLVLDTLQLRGTRGAVITASGVYRGTGPIAVSLDVSNVPVFVPGPAGPGDSVRIVLDATVRLEGTAERPHAAADLCHAIAHPVGRHPCGDLGQALRCLAAAEGGSKLILRQGL